jgi:hypothetical protein
LFALLAIVLVLSAQSVFAFLATISLNPGFGPPGMKVTVTGSGFTVSAQPYCNFVSTPAGLVGPNRNTDFVCMVAGDGSMAGWFVVAVGASGSYSVSVSYFTQASDPEQFAVTQPAPVGGVVEPVNYLMMLSPWLAVIGLVGCVGTMVVVNKKRES